MSNRRRYTKEERAEAIRLVEHLASIRAAAQKPEIPVARVRGWDARDLQLSLLTADAGSRPPLVGELQKLAYKLLDQLHKKLDAATFSQLVAALNMCLDKIRKLPSELGRVARENRPLDLSKLSLEELAHFEKLIAMVLPAHEEEIE